MPHAQPSPMATKLSEILKDQEYCLLTTFRKNGEGVPTPMWFVLQDDALSMTTRGESWKVKRLRRTSKVTIGPCTSSGRPTGKQVEAQGTVVEDAAAVTEAVAALNKKYGFKKKLIDFGLRFAKDKTEAIIRVELSDGVAE